MKNRLHQSLEALVDIGRVLTSRVEDAKSSILAKIEGAVAAGEGEVAEDQVLSVNAAILVRPTDPDGNGAFEVTFVRRGDEMIPIATRDARWQVNVEKGETVLRAFGESAALLRLRPNGDVVIETTGTIYNGADTASDSFALASRVDSLENAFAAHVHLGGGGGPVTAVSPTYTPAGTASSRVRVDS